MAETRVKSIRFDGNSCGKPCGRVQTFRAKSVILLATYSTYNYHFLPHCSQLCNLKQRKYVVTRRAAINYLLDSLRYILHISCQHSKNYLPFQNSFGYPWHGFLDQGEKQKRVFLVVCVSHTEYEGSTI